MTPLALARRLRTAFEPLQGKVIRLEVSELGTGPQFTVLGPLLLPSFGRADVTVRASLGDYVALALRREDPDSLFFARRLAIEGDTALGVALKNALDSLG